MEEVATRDGTDYGAREVTLGEKVAALRRRLEEGAAVVVFDEATGTANIVSREQLAARRPRPAGRRGGLNPGPEAGPRR
nr:YheU family protein [Dissulfurirhabdus thermomarina]